MAIASGGSLRAAAEAMHVSQPALTKTLRQLEEEFGTALVLRTPKGARLTPAGELVAARAASILREVQRAHDEVAWHLNRPSMQVTVGVSPSVAILLVPRAFARLRARWPDVRLRIVDAHYPHALAQVRGGEIDFALVPLPPGAPLVDLTLHPLFEGRIVIAAHRSHPLSRVKRLAGLSEASWVMTGPPGGFGDPARLPFAELGLAIPPVAVECPSYSTLLSLLPGTELLGILPHTFFERHALHYELVALPLDDALPNVLVHSIVRADALLTPPAQRLLEAFTLEAGGVS